MGGVRDDAFGQWPRRPQSRTLVATGDDRWRGEDRGGDDRWRGRDRWDGDDRGDYRGGDRNRGDEPDYARDRYYPDVHLEPWRGPRDWNMRRGGDWRGPEPQDFDMPPRRRR